MADASPINWLAATVRNLVNRVQTLEKELLLAKSCPIDNYMPKVISLYDALACDLSTRPCSWNPDAPVFCPRSEQNKIIQVQGLPLTEVDESSLVFSLQEEDLEVDQVVHQTEDSLHIARSRKSSIDSGVMLTPVKAIDSAPDLGVPSKWELLPSVGTWCLLCPAMEFKSTQAPIQADINYGSASEYAFGKATVEPREMTMAEFVAAAASARHRLPHRMALDAQPLYLKNTSEQDDASRMFLRTVREDRPHLERIISQCVEPAWKGGQNRVADLLIDLLQMYRRSFQSSEGGCSDADLLWILDIRIQMNTDPHDLVEEMRLSRRALLKEISPRRKRRPRRN